MELLKERRGERERNKKEKKNTWRNHSQNFSKFGKQQQQQQQKITINPQSKKLSEAKAKQTNKQKEITQKNIIFKLLNRNDEEKNHKSSQKAGVWE